MFSLVDACSPETEKGNWASPFSESSAVAYFTCSFWDRETAGTPFQSPRSSWDSAASGSYLCSRSYLRTAVLPEPFLHSSDLLKKAREGCVFVDR